MRVSPCSFCSVDGCTDNHGRAVDDEGEMITIGDLPDMVRLGILDWPPLTEEEDRREKWFRGRHIAKTTGARCLAVVDELCRHIDAAFLVAEGRFVEARELGIGDIEEERRLFSVVESERVTIHKIRREVAQMAWDTAPRKVKR